MLGSVNPLGRLVGPRIVRSEHVLDYLQIEFETGAILSVYNSLLPPAPDVASFLGQALESFTSTDTRLALCFTNHAVLVVDLSDAGCLGPEAMELSEPGQPIVVWP